MLLILLGLAIGWAGSSLLSSPIEDHSVEEQYFQSRKPQLANNKLSNEKLSQSPIDSEPVSVPDVQPPNSNERLTLLDLIKNGSVDHQLTASKIIDYLKLILEDPAKSAMQERELRKLLRENPELQFALLDQFASIDHPRTKMQLSMIFMINNSAQKPFLEPKLIEKIKLNEGRSEMLKMLGQWGLQSKSNLQYLYGELPYMDDPEDAGAAIRAISNSSWVRRSALQPSVMQDLREAINEYRASIDPQIRAAAVAAMRTIAPKEYRQKLLESFDDSSEIVRREAMQLYINNPFKSSDLEGKLFKNLQDSSLSYKERSSIAFGLARLGLAEEQKNVVKEVQKELMEHVESLSAAEQHALFAE